MIYQNACGMWRMDVSSPHPAWVRIECDDYGSVTKLPAVKVEDLRDLKHLLERAIEKIVAENAE